MRTMQNLNYTHTKPTPQQKQKNPTIMKVTLLTFLVYIYTAVSGQEEDSTNGLATLDSSRRFGRWLDPLESAGIAELPTVFLNQLSRAATASKFCMQFRALKGKNAQS